MREIRMLRAMWRELETGLMGTAPALDPTRHVGHLMGEANELVGLPLSLLETDGNSVSLRTASTLAAPEVFERFMVAECPGHQRLMISSPDLQIELFELLGVSAHHRALSRRACDYWANYLAGEPLTRRA